MATWMQHNLLCSIKTPSVIPLAVIDCIGCQWHIVKLPSGMGSIFIQPLLFEIIFGHFKE